MKLRLIYPIGVMTLAVASFSLFVVLADSNGGQGISIKRVQSFDSSHKLVAQFLVTSTGTVTGIKYQWYSSGELEAIIPYDERGLITGNLLVFYKDYPNCIVCSESRRGNILDGPVETYYPSGMIKTRQIFVNGKQVGPTLEYNDKGKISKVTAAF
jgi:antitoxin component YwqK of YwqJK toxin-antitoxin module